MSLIIHVKDDAEKIDTLEKAAAKLIALWREQGNEIVKYDALYLKAFDVYSFWLANISLVKIERSFLERDMYMAIRRQFINELSA